MFEGRFHDITFSTHERGRDERSKSGNAYQRRQGLGSSTLFTEDYSKELNCNLCPSLLHLRLGHDEELVV
jgi:hypothetical protein